MGRWVVGPGQSAVAREPVDLVVSGYRGLVYVRFARVLSLCFVFGVASRSANNKPAQLLLRAKE